MPDTRRGVLTCQGVDRGYLALAPPSPTSLVLVLHGSDADASVFRTFTGRTFDALADRGSLVVYAEAYGGIWNDARLGTRSPAREAGLDDVGFLSSLVETLLTSYDVPTDRVYVVGFSHGGQMTLRLIMQAPDLLAAAAILSSNHPAPDNVLPEMAELDRHQPVPVLTMSGTADPIVPFEGGVPSLWGRQPRGLVLSASASAEEFASRNGITAPPTTETLPGLSVTRWREDGHERVDFVVFEGGGHTVPNRRYVAPAELGPTRHDFDAGELVADFFGL
jgi:polyhydroxybutyrate depolymerase